MGEKAEIVGDGKARCDACFAGEAVWSYALPDGFSILKVQDVKTGNVYSPFRSAGKFGLCDECRGIIDVRAVPADVIPECFARRMMNRQPLTKTLDAQRRTFVKKALVSMFKRVLPHLVEQTPERYVLGSDPLHGKAMVLPGPIRPDGPPEENVMPKPTAN